MKQIREIIQTFEVSRPIFRLTIGDSHNRIDLNTHRPNYRYTPREAVEGEALYELVVNNYSESFVAVEGRFMFDAHRIAEQSMSDIREYIARFIAQNLAMKSPRQSKLYRWAHRSMPRTEDFDDVLVQMYKYLRTFAYENARTIDHKKTENALALLTAMENKYNE